MMHSKRVLWAATVRNRPWKEKFQITQDSGCDEMSAFPIDIQKWEADGHDISNLVKLSDTFGIKISILDPLTQWLPDW